MVENFYIGKLKSIKIYGATKENAKYDIEMINVEGNIQNKKAELFMIFNERVEGQNHTKQSQRKCHSVLDVLFHDPILFLRFNGANQSTR